VSSAQRDYYSRTAMDYDAMHLHEPEHQIALAILCGVVNHYRFRSVLDVGAGTGCVLRDGKDKMPGVRILGVEPVGALREEAYRHGIHESDLVDGDGNNPQFETSSFDVVSAFGVLHHVPNPARVVSEMMRVARRGIFISDLNCYGCGGRLKRATAQALYALRLWKTFQWIKTGGRMAKFSEGDGEYYSFSFFDILPLIRLRMHQIHLTGTGGTGTDLFRNATHVALFGLCKPEKIAVEPTNRPHSRYLAR
jgi:ubiquinone/menaquinone biosynthesis C-methylase UbiE